MSGNGARKRLVKRGLIPDYFRLEPVLAANDLVMQLQKWKPSVYQSPDYFSKD
ncbi:MAG: hypothetical protein IPP34_07770 [Bacteroidetes bacterium]|nr:hypothetical protein [Bacteroidota bacterium]